MLGVLLPALVVGCSSLPSGRMCPMFESSGGLSVQASQYAAAHRQAARLWACASRSETGCAHRKPSSSQDSATLAPGGVPALTLPGLPVGTWWARVVISTGTGVELVDAEVRVDMRSVGIAGCPNTMAVAGSVTVAADGTLRSP